MQAGQDEGGSPGDLTGLRRKVQLLEEVLGASTDPIFSILADGTYQYVNQAFTTPFGRIPEEVIGRRIYDLFPQEEAEKRMAVVRKAFAEGEIIVFEVRVPLPQGKDLFFITSVRPLKDAGGKVTSVVCISKDITDRKRVEAEREDLIEELKAALAEVRTLSGLLPICATCKKVRDDQGYWTQIEWYIRDHSEAEFTHGVCPDCAHDLYPEVFEEPPDA